MIQTCRKHERKTFHAGQKFGCQVCKSSAAQTKDVTWWLAHHVLTFLRVQFLYDEYILLSVSVWLVIIVSSAAAFMSAVGRKSSRAFLLPPPHHGEQLQRWAISWLGMGFHSRHHKRGRDGRGSGRPLPWDLPGKAHALPVGWRWSWCRIPSNYMCLPTSISGDIEDPIICSLFICVSRMRCQINVFSPPGMPVQEQHGRPDFSPHHWWGVVLPLREWRVVVVVVGWRMVALHTRQMPWDGSQFQNWHVACYTHTHRH